MRRIIETEVLCTNNSLDELGIESDDIWLPFSTDLEYITNVKFLQDDKVEDNNGKTTIYSNGQTYLINYDYYKFLKVWKEYKETKV